MQYFTVRGEAYLEGVVFDVSLDCLAAQAVGVIDIYFFVSIKIRKGGFLAVSEKSSVPAVVSSQPLSVSMISSGSPSVPSRR